MSKKLMQQLHEDRALRDAARTVLVADLEHARASFSAKGVAGRVGGRIGDGAKDVFEVAKVHADDNRGILAALIGALLIWISKDAILEILGLSPSQENAESAAEEIVTDNSVEAEPAPRELPDGDDDEQ